MKGRVLVVEDDEDLCEELRETLRGEGLEAEFAHSGRRGLEMAVNGRYDLVILDLKLPGGGGLGVLRDLSGRDLAPPILVVTGRPMEGDLNRGDAEGLKHEITELADGLITKPFDVTQLLSSIRALL